MSVLSNSPFAVNEFVVRDSGNIGVFKETTNTDMRGTSLNAVILYYYTRN